MQFRQSFYNLELSSVQWTKKEYCENTEWNSFAILFLHFSVTFPRDLRMPQQSFWMRTNHVKIGLFTRFVPLPELVSEKAF